jgi:hypothetical protein
MEDQNVNVSPYSFEMLVGVSPFIRFAGNSSKISPSASKADVTADNSVSCINNGLERLIEHIESQNKSGVHGILKTKAKSRFSLEPRPHPAGKRVSILLENTQCVELV